MGWLKRRFLLLGVVCSGFLPSAPALAECGGTTQCIAVGLTPADAQNAHHGGPAPATPTLAFGNQVIGAASAARTVYVAAVTGSPGTMAVLGPITLSGTDATAFSIAGGTCSTSNGPVHGGALCTIAIAFNPATVGAKSATLNVPVNPPGCVGCLTGRSVNLTGNATATPVVVGRPDPTQDPNVVGLINAQTQAAKRFSQVQINNFQRRMESLHRGASGGDAVASGTARFGSGWNRGRGPIADGTPAGWSASGGALRQEQIPLTGGADGLRQTRLPATASGLQPPLFAELLFSAASTRSVNLSGINDRAAGSSNPADGTGAWIGGNLVFGNRDATSDSASLGFSTDGVSAGIDRRVSDRLALGVGLGYARDRTDVGTDGTQSRSRGSSVAVYGSYQPTRNTFIDGLIGYGELSYDTDRYVASAGDFARAHRKGDQLFGSLAAGYEHRQDGLLLSPYGRLDFSTDRLRQATESGAGLDALTYFGQRLPTRQLALGLRVESRHQTNFGWALPRLRVELTHDFEGERPALIAYADQFSGPRYSVTPTGLNRNSLLVGIGSDFVFRSGLTLGVDYHLHRSFGPETSQAIRFWLAKALDGKGLRFALPSAGLYDDPVRVEAGFTWDNNVTRSRDSADKLSDHVFHLNVSKAAVLPVGSHTRAIITGFLNGERPHTYTDLGRFSGGAQAEFQYRTSAEFAAPTFGIFGRASRDEYHSELRSGYRYSIGLNARQSLTDRLDFFGALARNVRSAENAVFDARDYSARFNLDLSLGRAGTLYLGGELRRGDTVSSGRRSLENIAIAENFVRDDAYGSRQLYTYRVEAKTVLWTLGYNWPLGPRDSIDFSLRRAQSTPIHAPNYGLAGTYGFFGVTPAGGTSRYTSDQISVVYLMRF